MRSPIDQYIIDRVLERRKAKNKSQEDIAIKLGFKSNAYIGAIESMNPENEECYNNKQLNILAKFLECSHRDFVPEEPITSYIPKREFKSRKRINGLKKKMSKK